jgi:exodeoxyribonuclease VII small subunit
VEEDMKDKDLDFEKALADLEQTVDKLEKGGLNLNESLGLFEKGVKLARFLREELDKAEKKIAALRRALPRAKAAPKTPGTRRARRRPKSLPRAPQRRNRRTTTSFPFKGVRS